MIKIQIVVETCKLINLRMSSTYRSRPVLICEENNLRKHFERYATPDFIPNITDALSKHIYSILLNCLLRPYEFKELSKICDVFSVRTLCLN
jgi:hypothetical protein